MGRSRGGLTSKLHAITLDENRAVAFELTEGKASDYCSFDPLYKNLPQDNVFEYAALDKGYDSNAIRNTLAIDGIQPVIPPRSMRKTTILYNKDIYKERNRIERFFNKIKNFRRIATRYDKLKETFLAAIHLVAACISIRNS